MRLLSSQYCKLKRKLRVCPGVDGHVCIKATVCKYQGYDRKIKEQLRNDLDDENIIEEFIKEIIALKDTSEMSSEQVLMWVQRTQIQMAQKEVLDSLRDDEFDLVKKDRQKHSILGSKKDNGNEKRMVDLIIAAHGTCKGRAPHMARSAVDVINFTMLRHSARQQKAEARPEITTKLQGSA